MPVTLYAEERSTTVPFLIGETVRAVVIVCDRLPEEPLIVMVEVASLEEAAAVSVSLLVLAVLAGLKDAFTPGGSPDTLRLTSDLKFPRRVTKTVAVPLLPWGTEMASFAIRSEKSSAPGGGGARRS